MDLIIRPAAAVEAALVVVVVFLAVAAAAAVVAVVAVVFRSNEHVYFAQGRHKVKTTNIQVKLQI